MGYNPTVPLAIQLKMKPAIKYLSLTKTVFLKPYICAQASLISSNQNSSSSNVDPLVFAGGLVNRLHDGEARGGYKPVQLNSKQFQAAEQPTKIAREVSRG